MKNWLKFDTQEEKEELYKLFDKCSSKSEIFRHFNVSDGSSNCKMLEKAAKIIGFDFSIYKERKKKYCLKCGKQLKNGQYKFCSKSCAAKYNNKRRQPPTEETKRKISESLSKGKNNKYSSEPRYCKNCGKLIKRPKLYCNSECFQEYRQKEQFINWKNHPEKYNSENCPDFIKRYFIEKYNGCQICGWHEVNPSTGKCPLEIHHINGDCTDNREENLQLLCPNCHSLTPTMGALNKGNSKRYKYKTYRKEISNLTENKTVKTW